MSAENIYSILRKAGMSHNGACALLGNFKAESGLVAARLQGDFSTGYTRSLQYVAAVDAFEITNTDFIYHGPNGGGMGLAQWTYPQRKKNLLNFVRTLGVSIGDETAQTQFAIHEMQTDFPKIWQYCCQADCDRNTACDWICREFENPAHKNYEDRRKFAEEFDYLKDKPVIDSGNASATVKTNSAMPKDPTIYNLQLYMKLDGYWDGDIDGLRTQKWKAQFSEWSQAIIKL